MIDVDIEIDEDIFLPAYRHLMPYYDESGGLAADGSADINLLWGGRDSGKSHATAQRLVIDCLYSKYFQCVLFRKTANSIKESQYAAIKSVIEEWQLEELFDFRSSPLEIRCVNGNRFIARGCDEPGKLKSLNNFNVAWVEESNQLTETDFIVILTTLRSNKADVKLWLTFNPESDDVDYEDFWLYKLFFATLTRNLYNTNFVETYTVELPNAAPVSFTYTSTHTTYYDNLEYVKPLRRAFHETLANINPHYHAVYSRGIWSTNLPGQLWAYAYDPKKHRGRPTLRRDQEVYLSFDFNRNPMCCSVIQWYDECVKVIETIKLPNSNIHAMCDYINLHYHGCLFVVTGDATGKNSSALVQDNLNYYKVIAQKLNIGPRQFQVPTFNPDIKENSVLVNMVLATYSFELHETAAAYLHYDLTHVRALPNGTVDKGNRTDPTKQADALDTLRYWCNVFMPWLLKGV
jgi:PBSX family phage terminase large subunit